MKRRNSFRGKKSGFTLMEILLVLGLIGLLVSVVVVKSGSIFNDKKIELTRMKIKNSLNAPLFKYMTDTGSYPTTEQGLGALLSKPTGDRGGWRGPYVEGEESLLDAWKRDFKYRYPGTGNVGGYDLYSLGPDGTESEDDIKNWK